VTCDVLLCDPPYSQRTHDGYRGGYRSGTQKIEAYSCIEATDAQNIAREWEHRCRHWAIVFGDCISTQWHAQMWEATGWYVFAPVPWVATDKPPRMQGDGPASATEWITVARPKRVVRDPGSRPGYYLTRRERDGIVTGQKPLDLMRALIRDYSRPGDLICDPYAGSGTTLLAAVIEGRRAIGAEINPETHARASRRLRERLRQADLWTITRETKRPQAEQLEIGEGER